jgi:vacuolar protein sorting-associated protein 26
LRATIGRRITDIAQELTLIVHALSSYPETEPNIKMEVGIEDCLHIEFEYNKSKYDLADVIVGKIYFLLVRIKIKNMELSIMRRESVGSGPSLFHETDNVGKFEIMDGAPVKGESIPIRLFLAGYDLTPTMREIGKRFSVRYYLNLVLVDEEDRRYFKQHVSTLTCFCLNNLFFRRLFYSVVPRSSFANHSLNSLTATSSRLPRKLLNLQRKK